MATTEWRGRDTPPCFPWLYTGIARAFSLLAAGVLSLLVTFYPRALIQGGVTPDHLLLVLLMWGIAGGFVHGVGFVPRQRLLRAAFCPVMAWSLMLGGMLLMAVK